MSVYRCLFSDTFLNIEAQSEDEAQKIAAEMLRELIRPDDFITWQDETLPVSNPYAPSLPDCADHVGKFICHKCGAGIA